MPELQTLINAAKKQHSVSEERQNFRRGLVYRGVDLGGKIVTKKEANEDTATNSSQERYRPRTKE
jgi:hypothetical protein